MSSNILVNLYFVLPKLFRNTLTKFILSREGGYMYSNTIRTIYSKERNVTIGYGSYGGCFSKKNIPSGVTFGNYCSIAPEIRIFRANHPKENFTSHPFLYNPIAGFVKKDMLDRPSLIVGHDVWIGELAIILPGVKNIGNGAIVGAGSVVTKDVDPYQIVAGNPAKVIGSRFNTKIVSSLEQTQWWNFSKDELLNQVDYLKNIIRTDQK
ncbi:CatB-related O-acetyltransferase [uncultured Algoriphagus sp.]|uniref:CatB-related O-acetyltransferase n=1 Tax=uncultured Algoriphagus sp. TaxID=417365 RepID=UPI0030EBAF34|tara:strand:+ start:22853 stop:23479 length:627 start_codon:yes stop_codon:yes gene_type:complete